MFDFFDKIISAFNAFIDGIKFVIRLLIDTFDSLVKLIGMAINYVGELVGTLQIFPDFVYWILYLSITIGLLVILIRKR